MSKKSPVAGSVELPECIVQAARESGDPRKYKEEFLSYIAACSSGYEAWMRAIAIQDTKHKPRTPPTGRKPYWQAIDALRFEHVRLDDSFVRWAILQACDGNDVDFFLSLGRRLSGKRLSLMDLFPDKLTIFLTKFWDQMPGAPGLCFFTDEAITDLYHCFNRRPVDEITVEHVKEKRRSLKLKKAKPLRVSSVTPTKTGYVLDIKAGGK